MLCVFYVLVIHAWHRGHVVQWSRGVTVRLTASST